MKSLISDILLQRAGKRNWTIHPLVFFFNSLILIPQSRFDPDPHHDGYVFATAIASSEDLVPNRDFFAQYGPLAPILHGLFLKFTGPQLLALRILTALIIALSGLLVFILVGRFQTRFLALVAQTYWIISYPILPLPHSMPWASVISSFLMLLIIYTYLKTHDSHSKSLWFIMTGALMALLPLLRFQLILVPCLVTLNVLLLNRKEKHKRKNFLIVASAFSLITIIIFTMRHFGSLKSYILQCIIWPSQFYGVRYLPTNIFTKDGFIYWASWYYYPVFFLLVLYSHRRLVGHASRLNFSLRSKSFLIKCLIALILASGFILFSYANIYPKSYLNVVLQLQWLVLRLPLAFFYFLAVFIIIEAFKKIRHLSLFTQENVILLIACCSVFLLYPGSDPIHLWWSSPIMIVSFFALSERKRSHDKAEIEFRLPLLVIILCLSSLSLLLLPNNLKVVRVGFQSPLLHGMLAPKQNVQEIDNTLLMLRRYQEDYPDSVIQFDCRDGLYAVANGTYMPKSSHFVDWGPDVPKVSFPNSTHFLCYATEKDLGDSFPSSEFTIFSKVTLLNGKVNVIIAPKN